jgi:hypothetical protein
MPIIKLTLKQLLEIGPDITWDELQYKIDNKKHSKKANKKKPKIGKK